MLCKLKNNFYIEQIGNACDQTLSKDFVFKGESHYFFEALFVVSGCVQVTEDEKVYILNDGDIIFHAPMEFHCVKSYNGTSPHIRNLSFTVIGNPPSRIFDGMFHLNKEQQEFFTKCFDLTKEYTTDNINKYLGQYISSFFSSLLIDISTVLESKDSFSYETSALLYREIVVEMQEYIYKNISLYDLAMANNISVSYLKKLFRRYANTSPKTFYNSLRIKEAAHLLKEGLSVTTITEKMNFSSPNYFSLFFKKHIGCTPTEYKKTYEQRTLFSIVK